MFPDPRDSRWRRNCVSGCLWDFPGVNAPLRENGVLREAVLKETPVSSVLCVGV